MAASEIFLFEKFGVFLRKDNIIQIQTKDGFDCELKDAQNILESIKAVSGDRKYPLMSIYGNFNTYSKEVKTLSASHELTLADGLVYADNWALRMIGNLYITMYCPIRPTKIFSDEKSALIWLQSFNKYH